MASSTVEAVAARYAGSRPDVLRLAPPLVVTRDELQLFVDALPGLVRA